MATTNREPIQAARTAFAQARRDLVDRLYDHEKATQELKEAKRHLALQSELDPFQAAVNDAKSALDSARSAEAQHFAALQAALGAWLPTSGTALQSAEEDVERLEANAPIVLFPVRVETRFEGNMLKVRVYPDDISIDIHERALTVDEYEAARHYYRELNERDNERELWRDIVARFGVQRSAYILREMLPVFGDPGPGSSFSASSSTCGGTIFGGNNEDLFFPEDIQFRSSNWTRPAEAVLPDRWVFVTYRDGQRQLHLGNPILEPLQVAPDPNLPSEDSLSTLIATTGGDYQIDDKIRWTVDFARAVQVGMGIEIPLSTAEAAGGFDRLIVLGVKSSMTAQQTSRHLELLFDAHHYTEGLAIVRQGAPTNNTPNRPSPYPPQENAGQQSFIIERQRAPLDRHVAHHCLAKDTDGYALAFLLGVPSGVMANVDRAKEKEIHSAGLMNRALWPGTFGYFMRHMMDPVFDAQQIAQARTYFENYVRARGHGPAFRIGSSPYGIMPIAALSRWQPRSFGGLPQDLDQAMQGLETAAQDALERMLGIWLEGARQVPRIRPGSTNPDVDLAEVLSMAASARQFRRRCGEPFDATANLSLLFGFDVRDLFRRLGRQSRETFGRFGFPNWRPRLGTTQWRDAAPTFVQPVVASTGLSETAGLTNNYILGISNASARSLNQGTYAGASGAILNMVLRHSTLAEYSRIASENTSLLWVEWGFYGVLFPVAVPILPGVYQLDEQAMTLKSLASAHISALNALAVLPTAELERLFTETMDLAAYRLDAWITALAFRRIQDMRRVQENTELATKGDFLGGYCWLEEVRPRNHQPTTLPDGRTAEIQEHNGGFIHTPSMNHATAAALLKNAHLSYGAPDSSTFAIDLSSRRVREGRRLFEAVRNGQPVGAVLGYHFERVLHDAGLHRLRYDLRSRFPLVANKAGQDEDEPAESLAARNVVDGERLLAAHRKGELQFGSDPALPQPGSSAHGVMTTTLDDLEHRYDAAADLLTAEGVFQLVQGNVERAYPTLENILEGRQPPDTIISRSARGGIGIAHRVALVFPHDLALTGNWPAATPRALAEPVLNAWLGQLVGDPTTVDCSVSYLNEGGEVILTNDQQERAVVRLDELGLHPLDLFALAEVIAQSNQGSVLDQRIVATALADANRSPSETPTTLRIDYHVESGRGFPEVLEVLHAASAVLKDSRPLGARDLLPPAEIDEGLEEEEPLLHDSALELYQRGQAAATALLEAIGELAGAAGNEAAQRQALRHGALFAPLSAFPAPDASAEAVGLTAVGILQELQRRADVLPPALPPSQLSGPLFEQARQTFDAVFGTGFLTLPRVSPPRPDELSLSLDARDTLLAGDGAAPDKYLHQIMRSRPRLGRFRKLNLYARTVGLVRPRVDVIQLPYVPDERWLGLPFETEPEEGRAALLLLNYSAEPLDATAPWTGLTLDDWTEVIPHRIEDTGVAFHYQSPKSQAPQAVLVAAPSGASPHWTFDELLASLEQTMQLTRIRAVTQEHLDLGQVFPATVFGTNPNIENAVSTSIPEPFLFQGIRRALSHD